MVGEGAGSTPGGENYPPLESMPPRLVIALATIIRQCTFIESLSKGNASAIKMQGFKTYHLLRQTFIYTRGCKEEYGEPFIPLKHLN